MSEAASDAGRLRESMSMESSSAPAGAADPSRTTLARSTAREATNGPAPSMALVKSSAMIPIRKVTRKVEHRRRPSRRGVQRQDAGSSSERTRIAPSTGWLPIE